MTEIEVINVSPFNWTFLQGGNIVAVVTEDFVYEILVESLQKSGFSVWNRSEGRYA
jgi:hypothetical protein